jgi:peptidoglycan/xylan/chitin deacetylase (PgdA/CDA1 family)
MLNYRTTAHIVIILLLVLALVAYTLDLPPWVMAVAVGASLTLLICGSVCVCSGFYVPAVCKGKPGKNRIALTFDDGPDPEVTPRILDILKDQEIPAAFFCIGEKASQHPSIITRMAGEGHIIGNHSYSHGVVFDLKRRGSMVRDIAEAGETIWRICGSKPAWFRPPYGVTNPAVAYAAGKLGYTVIGWSVRSKDSTTSNPAKVMARIRRKWKDGGIILLHDTHDNAVILLEEIIRHARETGYRLSRLDEMTGLDPYVKSKA